MNMKSFIEHILNKPVRIISFDEDGVLVFESEVDINIDGINKISLKDSCFSIYYVVIEKERVRQEYKPGVRTSTMPPVQEKDESWVPPVPFHFGLPNL